MKKIIFMMLLFLTAICTVNANEYYYINSNGVEFTKEEYEKISEFYWNGYQDNISLDDLTFLKENGFFENEIETITINDINSNIMPYVEHTTSSKSLKMSKSCLTNCIISVTLTWLKSPTIRSYDILGVYLDNTSSIVVGKVFVDTDTTSTTYSYTNKASNGVGTSFLLPTNNFNSLRISQTLQVENKGTINASYQHAKKAISLANSKKYSFSRTGIGGVFKFDSGIQDYYDCMLGVQLKLG